MKCSSKRVVVTSLISGAGCFALTVFSVLSFSYQSTSQPKNGYEPQLCVARYDYHLNFLIPVSHIPSDWRSGLSVEEPTRYLSMGWGERTFYAASPTELLPTLGLGVRALVLPNASVIRVRQLQELPEQYECVPASDAEIKRLIQFIGDSFQRSPQGAVIPVAGSPRLLAKFYAAEGTYSLFNNSNSWMADGLEAAGVRLPPWAISSGAIMTYLQNLHEVHD